MQYVHLSVGVAVVLSAVVAGVLGAVSWYQGVNSRSFWLVLRFAQGTLFVQVALGGLLVALGHEPPDLHLVYGLLPLGVMFVAEQLRVAAAETVLQQRNFDSAKDVGKLPEEQQHQVVRAIVRREVGAMTAAALVTAVLALRAAGTTGIF